MSIAGVGDTCKGWFEAIPRDVLVVVALMLASSAAFGLGYLTGQGAGQGRGVTIEVVPPADTTAQAAREPAAAAAAGEGAGARVQVGKYVASKNGTKYYLPTCSGAKRISEANKVWFATAAAAVAEGYTPAANCPGL